MGPRGPLPAELELSKEEKKRQDDYDESMEFLEGAASQLVTSLSFDVKDAYDSPGFKKAIEKIGFHETINMFVMQILKEMGFNSPFMRDENPEVVMCQFWKLLEMSREYRKEMDKGDSE